MLFIEAVTQHQCRKAKGKSYDGQWRNRNIIVSQSKPAHKEVICVSAKLILVARANTDGLAEHLNLLFLRTNNLLKTLYSCSLHASRV